MMLGNSLLHSTFRSLKRFAGELYETSAIATEEKNLDVLTHDTMQQKRKVICTWNIFALRTHIYIATSQGYERSFCIIYFLKLLKITKKFKQGKRTYIILLYKNVNNGIFYSLKMPTAFNKLSRFKPILAVNRLIYRPGIRLLKEKKSLCLKHIITFWYFYATKWHVTWRTYATTLAT